MESNLDVPGEIIIGEVNVFVDFTHTYIGDLRLTLISPLGTAVVLHSRSGGSTDNIRTWYDTQTQPAEPLSRFNGENSAGRWTLRVEDQAGADTGTLNAWTIELCGQSAAPRPFLSYVGYTMDDSATCNPDGYADVGEIPVYRVTVQNTGPGPATDVRVSLSSPADVEALDSPASIGTLLAGQSVDVDFHVESGAVGSHGDCDLQRHDDGRRGPVDRRFHRSARRGRRVEILIIALTQSYSTTIHQGKYT